MARQWGYKQKKARCCFLGTHRIFVLQKLREDTMMDKDSESRSARPGFITNQLCDFEQVTSSPWACFYLSNGMTGYLWFPNGLLRIQERMSEWDSWRNKMLNNVSSRNHLNNIKILYKKIFFLNLNLQKHHALKCSRSNLSLRGKEGKEIRAISLQ